MELVGTPRDIVMKFSRRLFLFAVCLALLAGCRSPEAVESPPTDEDLLIGVPPGAVFAPVSLDPASTIRFDRITGEDGLSQNVVLSIAQDHRGFMWFGTEDGLNKYDGYQFTVYKHNPDNPTTLSDNFVSVIYQDRAGVLWIGTRNGLNRLDSSTGKFTRYEHDPDDARSIGGTWVVSLCAGRDGALWIGTDDGGLDRFDRDTGTFAHYRHDPDDPTSLSDDGVGVIYEDQEGALWVGTDVGLDLLDRETGAFTHFQNRPGDPQSLSGAEVSAITEDRDGMLWVGTEDGGLNRLDRSSGSALSESTFARYRQDDAEPQGLVHDRVKSIFSDSAGRLWIGTQNGLDLYDPDHDRFIHIQHDPGDPSSLSSNAVWSIYEDHTGVLWFGTYGGGVSKYNRITDQFALYQHKPGLANSLSDNMIWAIHEDADGVLWIGTFNGGLNRLDREAGELFVYRHDPENADSLSSDDVRAILEDHTGALWVGTGGGLDRFDRTSGAALEEGAFVHYRHDPGDPTSLSENRVSVLFEDHRGNLWIGTRTGGLNRFDRDTETFVRYQYDEGDSTSLSNDRVWALYEDSAGKLWVGTLGGVSVWDPDTDQFVRYLNDPDDPQSLSNDAVFAFHEDAEGTMWIGTWGSGLDRFDHETGDAPGGGAFGHYTEKDGLANNVIYGIEADLEGNMWMSTNKGLSKFDPRTEAFRNYDVRDGLQDNEFNVGAHFASPSGELFFGGIRGFNGFYPTQVTGNPLAPPVVITAFGKFNEVKREDLTLGEHIELTYQDDFIFFEFAALDYTAPDKNRYMYMLEGQDETWIDAGPRRHADYTNLRGGDYVFRVKASNNDGVWNEEGAFVTLTVTPPIWETWWFRGGAILLLAVGVVGGYWLRVRSVEARSRKLKRQVEERSRELKVLLEAEQRRAEQFRVIGEVGYHITSILAIDELLRQIVLLLKEAFGYNLVGIGLVEGDAVVFKPGAAIFGSGAQLDRLLRFKVGQEGIVGWVADSGEPLLIPDISQEPRYRHEPETRDCQSALVVPLKVKGAVIGVLDVESDRLDDFDESDIAVVQSLAHQIAVAVDNARLFEEAQQLAVLKERQRLARDLHDAVTQTLFSASLIAEVLPRIWERDSDEGQRRLAEVRELTRGALAEMRTLLLELRPSALADAELGDLLRQLAEATTGRARVPVSVQVEGTYSHRCTLSTIPPDVKVALYRIAQEALNNVAKHSGASQATVRLCCGPERVALHVTDDGRGFDVDAIPPDHLGVGIMRERAETIGAELTINSEPERGTEVSVAWASAIN
jgi:signal transduction histidine kinase/ligand-binding sensor domain-containing protein